MKYVDIVTDRDCEVNFVTVIKICVMILLYTFEVKGKLLDVKIMSDREARYSNIPVYLAGTEG